MHVILCTVFVCNWAPGLALRGPTGSMSRAYDATRGERRHLHVLTVAHSLRVVCRVGEHGRCARRHIYGVFILSLFTFAIQTVLAVWVQDDVPGVTNHGIVAGTPLAARTFER